MERERHLDTSLRDLKALLTAMGGHVERAIEYATKALIELDSSKLHYVYESEKKINDAHIQVDEDCLRILALQQPMAVDLRLIVSVLKINTDLERMGDQAVNIAQNGTRYLGGSPLRQFVNLAKISSEVKTMVRESLDAFVTQDERKALNVLERDDKVDALKARIFQEVIEHLKTHPADVEPGVTLILIARNLERIGDHATNIAEDVIFSTTGRDVRHKPRDDQMFRKLYPKP
jgi:phosphate transport system protein